MHKKYLKKIGDKLDVLEKIKNTPAAHNWYQSTETGLKHLNNLLPDIEHLRRIVRYQKKLGEFKLAKFPKRYRKRIKIRVGSSDVYLRE